MEKEGLMRGLRELEEKGLTISSLVTDRHAGIQKWLREEKPTITAYYDIWHVAKSNCIEFLLSKQCNVLNLFI